jgi:ABC-type dipeptide/oligopeptide/nickel transport system ATPase component
MYCGKIIEIAETAELYKHPRHPYTRGLLESIPAGPGEEDSSPSRSSRGWFRTWPNCRAAAVLPTAARRWRNAAAMQEPSLE